jgi:hypothetical protein
MVQTNYNLVVTIETNYISYHLMNNKNLHWNDHIIIKTKKLKYVMWLSGILNNSVKTTVIRKKRK